MILFEQNNPKFRCFCQAPSNTPKSLKQPYFNMLSQNLSLNFTPVKYTQQFNYNNSYNKLWDKEGWKTSAKS
jgi:hypothetical protein